MQKLVFLLLIVCGFCSAGIIIADHSTDKKVTINLKNDLAGSFQYDNEIKSHDQFDHKFRGSDGVTYGCFGWHDPNGKLHITFYIADSHGYRPYLNPKASFKIYPKDSIDEGVLADFDIDKRYKAGAHQPQYSTVKDYSDLHFPPQCIQKYQSDLERKPIEPFKPPPIVKKVEVQTTTTRKPTTKTTTKTTQKITPTITPKLKVTTKSPVVTVPTSVTEPAPTRSSLPQRIVIGLKRLSTNTSIPVKVLEKPKMPSKNDLIQNELKTPILIGMKRFPPTPLHLIIPDFRRIPADPLDFKTVGKDIFLKRPAPEANSFLLPPPLSIAPIKRISIPPLMEIVDNCVNGHLDCYDPPAFDTVPKIKKIESPPAISRMYNPPQLTHLYDAPTDMKSEIIENLELPKCQPNCNDIPSPIIFYIYYNESQLKPFTFDPEQHPQKQADEVVSGPDCELKSTLVSGAPNFL